MNIYYKNDQWMVTDYGFETISEDCDYEYNKDFVNEHTFKHIAGKSWVDPQSWIDAFEAGVKIHKLKFDLHSEEWKREKEELIFRKQYYENRSSIRNNDFLRFSDIQNDYDEYIKAYEAHFKRKHAA